MILYHSFMYTDIDKWHTITLVKPDKPDDEWWWDYMEVEVNSWYEFFQVIPDIDTLEDYDFMSTLSKEFK